MAGYIKFEGIDGESQDQRHDKWSDLISFDELMELPHTATGQARSRLTVDHMRVVKVVDAASTQLLQKLDQKTPFPSVKIEVTRSYTNGGRKRYLWIELKNVLIVSYHISGNCDATSGDEIPTEEIAMSFTTFDMSYEQADQAGNVQGSSNTVIDLEEK